MLALRDPGGALGQIVARTIAALPERDTGRRDPADGPRGFVQALTPPRPTTRPALIAEFKPRSPSRGELRPGATPDDLAPAYGRAAAISVLVDGPSFGGSYAALRRMRALLPQPVLAKGFFVDPRQVQEAWAHGADAVLLMAALLPPPSLRSLLELCDALGLDALVEAHTAEELEEVASSGAKLIGVNSRDLRSMRIDLDRARRLLATLPQDRVRVCESGLQTRADIDAVRELAEAVLIGSALMTAPDPAAKIQEMGL